VKNTRIGIVSILIIFVLTGVGFSIEDTEVASAYVPVEDPVYHFLENCAARGVLPMSCTTLKPLSRSEISLLLHGVVSGFDKLNDKVLMADLDYYFSEYSLDVERLNKSDRVPQRQVRSVLYNPAKALNSPHWHFSAINSDYFSFVCDPVGRIQWDFSDDRTILRRASGLQFRGDIVNRLGYYFRFVDNTERGNGPYSKRDSLLEDRYGYVGPLLGGKETYYDMTEAYLTTTWKMFEFAFGKDRAAWGPGEERLLLSGYSPSFNHFNFRCQLGSKVRFSYIVGKLHPCDSEGNALGDTLYRTNEGWTRVVPSDKWITAHRLEYFLGKSIVIGVSEALIWGERGLDFAYLNPLNFLFSAEHDGGDLDNVLLEGDLSVRLARLGILYGSLLIDDLKISTLGEGDPGNRFGLTIGMRIYNLGLDGIETGLEYVRLEPFVYSHFYAVNRYTTWTSNLGSSLKPNSDRIRWLLNYRPLRQVALNLRVDWNRHASTGGEIEQIIPRNSGELPSTVDFLDGDRSDWTEIETSILWEFFTGTICKAGWITGAESTAIPDRFFIGISYRY